MGCGKCRRQIEVTRARAAQAMANLKKPKAPEYNGEDGSITFNSVDLVTDVEGYEKDPENELRLVTLMPPCDTRFSSLMSSKGSYKVHNVCMGKTPHKGKVVDVDICNGCPLKNGGKG